MTQPPTVSVLMPAFNAGGFLKVAVQSILNQTFTNFELIIVDDGSTDDSFSTLLNIDDARIKIVHSQKNLGVIAARNMALDLATSPLLACLDADDVALPERLARQVAMFDSNQDLVLLGSNAQLIDEHGNPFDVVDVPTRAAEIRRGILHGNLLVHSSVMMRASIVRSLGGYPVNHSLAEDYALWLRIITDHKVMNLPERLVQYRVHSGQMSQRQVSLMWSATRTIQRQYWLSLLRAGKSEGVLQPFTQTFWSTITGGNGSLGRDCLYWARLYRKMGDWPAAFRMVASGLISAPFCIPLYAALLSPDLLLRWRNEKSN